MITKHNVEEYILMYVDQELSNEESAILLSFLEEYPEFNEMLVDYQTTVVEMDTEMVYPDKAKLYRNEKVEKTAVILPMQTKHSKWWKYMAVASVVALISFGANQLFVANVIEVKQLGDHTIAANNSAVIPVKTLSNRTEDDKLPPIAPRIAKPSTVIRASNSKLPVINDVQQQQIEIIEVEEMALLANNRMPIATSSQKLHSSFSKPQFVVNKEASNLLGDNVINNPLIADIREQVKEKIEDFKEVSEVIKYASISLSVGNKNIVIKK